MVNDWLCGGKRSLTFTLLAQNKWFMIVNTHTSQIYLSAMRESYYDQVILLLRPSIQFLVQK